MNEENNSFGHPGNYYADSQHKTTWGTKKKLSPVEKFIAEMLREYEPQLKDRVQRAFKQWNLILSDYLRNEMALRLTIGDEAQSVPVRIQDGLPIPFSMVVENFEPEVWRMLFNLPLLENTHAGLDFVSKHFSFISQWKALGTCPTNKNELENVHILLNQIVKELQELDLLRKIKGIHSTE